MVTLELCLAHENTVYCISVCCRGYRYCYYYYYYHYYWRESFQTQ